MLLGAIFEDWLRKWDKILKKADRKVLLYIDNCSAHPPNLELDCIVLKFFPPNTTAISQVSDFILICNEASRNSFYPMNQGIIQNLKVHYRRFLLRERIKAFDENKDILINLLGALHILRKAWMEVKGETIANCFRHANFVINNEVRLEWYRI